MRKYEEQLTQDALLLDRYLGQYRLCIKRKKSLESRRDEIVKEFDNPLKGVSYDGTQKGGGESLGCAALSYRLDEISTRIEKQIEEAVEVLTDIMDVIALLPENSIERAIIEHRYIDHHNWKQVCRAEHISRTPATRHWRKGLYQLLNFKKVKSILCDYEKQQEEKFF